MTELIAGRTVEESGDDWRECRESDKVNRGKQTGNNDD